MTTLALELVDSGIRFAGDRGDRRSGHEEYPGFARIEGRLIVTGSRARSEWRRQPRAVHHRFWERLDTTHLEPPLPRSLTHADLVHAQLEAIWSDHGDGVDEVFLAVPGTLGVDQLGLLLGIARSCAIPVRGMIDAAVAATSRLEGPRVLHLDLHLHRAVLTEALLHSGIERGAVAVEEACGLVEVQELAARRIARIFLRATRFDPLHEATAEQFLFDRLPTWLQSWGRGEAVLATLVKGAREISLDVTAGEMVEALEPVLERLAAMVRQRSSEETLLVLTPRAAAIPGLAERVGELTLNRITTLSAGAAAQGALALGPSIRRQGASVEHVLRLPSPAAESGRPVAQASSLAPSPCQPPYLLLGFAAHAIGDEPLGIGTVGSHVAVVREGQSGAERFGSLRWNGDSAWLEVLPGASIRLNDRDITGSSPVQPGDRIRIAENEPELLLISVSENGAT